YIAPHWCKNSLRPPHSFFSPAKTSELGRPQRCFCGRKKLVELRRLDGGPGEHGVRLSTMVDLVLEEMHEGAVAALCLYPRLAIYSHDATKQVRRQRIADRDQALVGSCLSTLQFCSGRTGNLVHPSFWPEPSTLKRVDIEQADDVIVVQRQLQTREE